ncbi:MAG: VanZ family protein [Owenweeksia sp.]
MASVLPGSNIPSVFYGMDDKFIHISIYFVIYILIYLGFTRYQFVNPIPRGVAWFIVISCASFGGVLELVQHYMVPSRTGEWLDFSANTCGLILGALLMRTIHRLKA